MKHSFRECRRIVKDLQDFRPGMEEEDRSPGLALMVLGAGIFVILLMAAIIAGLSYPHWKHLIF